MFGYSPQYTQGVMDQQVRGNLARNDDRRQAEASVAQWQRYARNLEERLAQAQAETFAARVQRHVLSGTMDRLIEALRATDPNHPLCNQVALVAENRRAVDEMLAAQKIALVRNNSGEAEVVRHG